MTDFREDGAAALEWAARYLERVPELPVLAQVEPGRALRAAAGVRRPSSPSRSPTSSATSTSCSCRR